MLPHMRYVWYEWPQFFRGRLFLLHELSPTGLMRREEGIVEIDKGIGHQSQVARESARHRTDNYTDASRLHLAHERFEIGVSAE